MPTGFTQDTLVTSGTNQTGVPCPPRDCSANASWAAQDHRFSLDANSIKLHLDSVFGLAFFAGTGRPVGRSLSQLYLSNIQAANLSAHFGLTRGADLYVGYSITKDADGPASAMLPGVTDPLQTLFGREDLPAGVPAPLARVSIRVTPKIHWNGRVAVLPLPRSSG